MKEFSGTTPSATVATLRCGSEGVPSKDARSSFSPCLVDKKKSAWKIAALSGLLAAEYGPTRGDSICDDAIADAGDDAGKETAEHWHC